MVRIRVAAALCIATIAPALHGQSDDALAFELATCAAYYLNATNAHSMREYEALYGAGERAINRIREIADREIADRLIGDASAAMTALTGGDWREFGRIDALYQSQCAGLVGVVE